MKTYTVQIDGDNDLEQITLQIAGEEAGASEFLESAISADKMSNLCKFKTLAPGKRPKPLTLIPLGEKAPDGGKLIWEGKMIVLGKVKDVQAYRAI
jgi:hypothetical protein